MSDIKQFWGATFFTGIQSAVRLVANFTMGKLAAVYLGSGGIALLGQFQNLALLVQNFSNGAIQNGIIRHIAAEKISHKRQPYLQTAFSISLAGGLLSGLLIIAFSPFINQKLLGIESYKLVLGALGFASVFFSLNVMIASLHNALKDYKGLAIFNMLQSLCLLSLFVPLTYFYGLKGALLSVSFAQVATFGAGWFFFKKKYREIHGMISLKWQRAETKQLAAFSLMTLVTVITFSASQLLIRSHLISISSLQVAGFWEGLNRISNFYLFFVNFLITSYILPRYAEAVNAAEILSQLRFNASRMLGLMAGIILLVYLLRGFVIRFVFTPEFAPIAEVMGWHLTGDFLKIAAWIFSNFLVARKYMKSFLATDFLYHAGFTISALFFAENLKEVTMLYAFSGFLYLLIIIPVSMAGIKKEFGNGGL